MFKILIFGIVSFSFPFYLCQSETKKQLPVYGNYFELPTNGFNDLKKLKEFAELDMLKTPMFFQNAPPHIESLGITGSGNLKEIIISQKKIVVMEKRVFSEDLLLCSQIVLFKNESSKYKPLFISPILISRTGQEVYVVNKNENSITIERHANKKNTTVVTINSSILDD